MKATVGVCLVLGVVACGGDSSGPGPQAASVTGVAGDNQSAARGGALPFPLSFTALGSNGQPIQGVAVSWSVTPAGGATFSAPTSQTDVNGLASTTVTLGTTLGAITIQATVAGVSPVVYHATVLDPCTILAPYTFGATVNGALTTVDCLVQFGQLSWFYDYYALTLPPGQQSVRINMRGTDTTLEDTYLDLYTESGQGVGFDDDSILNTAGARNSQLDIILAGGNYVIGANSYSPLDTGPYSLSSETRPAAMSGCRQVWLTRGVIVSDSITSADCADSSATPRRYDVARIIALSGTVLTISQRSTAINPSLALYQGNFTQNGFVRTLVASNDDSLSGTNDDAFIQYTAPAANFYDVIISTSAAGETGTYTLEVSASTTLSPRLSGRVSAVRDRRAWWRDVGLPKRSQR